MKSGKKPKEDPSAEVLRARQVEDLAELDEEENRRIKALLRPRLGGRAFRPAGALRAPSNTAGTGGGAFGTGGGFRGGAGGGGGSRRGRAQPV